MKKIFAIALALVMVLSMASAFAWCPTISWACDTYTCTNGTGKVEVVPFVKGNACGGNSFTANTCAGAINGDAVYFAIKVTVDADASADWWQAATLKVTEKGMATNGFYYGAAITDTGVPYFQWTGLDTMIKAANTDGSLAAGVYYIAKNAAGNWAAIKEADFEVDANTVYAAKVADAAKAKVCATLTSAVDFATKTVEVNGYTVKYVKDATNPTAVLEISKGGKTVYVLVNDDDKVVAFGLNDGVTPYTVSTYNADKTAFWANNADLSWTCNDLGKFLKAVMEYFQIDFGTCITDKAVKANFGWDDKSESCFSWYDKVQAVVDAECVVAIPKTGDKSVLAWLF